MPSRSAGVPYATSANQVARQIGDHTVRATRPTTSVPITIVAVNGTRRSRSGKPPVRREAHSSNEAFGAPGLVTAGAAVSTYGVEIFPQLRSQ